MSKSIWSTLGLTATRDIGAIKRAYAVRLKTLDLDNQLDKFQALRQARDAAIALATDDGDPDDRSLAADVGIGDDDRWTGDADPPAPPIHQASQSPSPPPMVEIDADEVALEDHHQALATILFQISEEGNFFAATPDEDAAMQAHFAAIAGSPKMLDVGTLTNVAAWFAGAIAQMIPRSDGLIDPAARLFGWTRADVIGSDPAIAAVMQRSADLGFAQAISDRRHRLNRSWLELQKPAREGSSRGWVSARKVKQLLLEIRTDHPSLERSLDWYRVSLWDNAEVGPRLAMILRLLVVASFIAVLHYCDAQDPATGPASVFADPHPAADVLTNQAGDVDAVLAQASGGLLTGVDVSNRNPRLYDKLQSSWDKAVTSGGSRSRYFSDMENLIDTQRASIWPYATPALLVDRFTLDRDILRSLGQTSGEACLARLEGAAPQLFASQRKRVDRLIADQVLQIDPSRPVRDTIAKTVRFSIPADVVADARRRSGLGSRFVPALDHKGKPLDICMAQIALFDSALALPFGPRNAMLRDMASD